MCCTRPSSSHPDTEGNLWHLDEKLNVTHLCQYETIKAAAQRDEVDNVTESREGRRSGLRCKTHTHEKVFIFSCIRTHIFSSSLCVCVLSLELSSRVSRSKTTPQAFRLLYLPTLCSASLPPFHCSLFLFRPLVPPLCGGTGHDAPPGTPQRRGRRGWNRKREQWKGGRVGGMQNTRLVGIGAGTLEVWSCSRNSATQFKREPIKSRSQCKPSSWNVQAIVKPHRHHFITVEING